MEKLHIFLYYKVNIFIQQRSLPFSNLKSLLDQNLLVFRYNKKLNCFSLIGADYLLSIPYAETDIYIFLTKQDDTKRYFCHSFFPKDKPFIP